MTTMRAIVIDQPGAPDVLTVSEIPRPIRIASEVLVKVVAAGLNPIDAKTRAGRGTSPAITSAPTVLGQDFSGVVVETPYEAHPLKPGDEVFGYAQVPRHSGSYAEYISVPSLNVARKPVVLSHVEAAGVPVAALTAWGMVVDVAKAHEGQRILVHAAAGGVGHFAVQFATYFGAHVIATGSAHNEKWLRELGAAEFIDYRSTAFDEVLSDVDVVIDLVGNATDATGTRSLSVLRPGGLVINAPSGTWATVAEDAAAAGRRGTRFQVAPDGATLAVISRLLTSGDVRVYIDEVFEFADAPRAHEKLEGGHSRGKSVLKVCEG
jgi:NADPH:quinone reductase-like Zn-dependent oxidoreductase